MEKTYKKIIILISMVLVSIIMFSNYSYAGTANSKEFKSFNNAPRMTLSTNNNELSDVTLTIKDNTGIKSVKLYETDKNFKNEKEIMTKDKMKVAKTKSSKDIELSYVLSHDNYLKSKNKYFKIEIKDEKDMSLISYFRIKVKTGKSNNKSYKYYSIDYAPRVKSFKIDGTKLSFVVKDASGTKSVKIYDMNSNSEKVINEFEDLEKGNVTLEVDLNENKYTNISTEKYSLYKLKIVTEDNYNVEAERIINFKIYPIALNKITLDKSELKMDLKQETELKATFDPYNATNVNLQWESSNPEIAKVENGKVTAMAKGTATITASSGEKTATCNVIVSDKEYIAVTKITLDKTLTVNVGKTATLTATINPDNATDKTVTWETSNEKIATVSAKGKVKAIKAGTATITATSSNGKKATCKITVKSTADDKRNEWLAKCNEIGKALSDKELNLKFDIDCSTPKNRNCVKKNGYINCASYVSYCLQEYKDILKTNQTFYSDKNGKLQGKQDAVTRLKGSKKVQIINVNKAVKNYYTNLQEGDIVCYEGHINIYVKQGKDNKLVYYDAGPAATNDHSKNGHGYYYKGNGIVNVSRGGKYGKEGNKKITKIIRIKFDSI